jgi:hypothetical protein
MGIAFFLLATSGADAVLGLYAPRETNIRQEVVGVSYLRCEASGAGKYQKLKRDNGEMFTSGCNFGLIYMSTRTG